MKWKTPQWGDYRHTTKFLWLPVSYNGQARWLERVRVLQRCHHGFFGFTWIIVSFEDDK